MALPKATSPGEVQRLLLDGREVEFRLTRSAVAKKLRIKVGPDGINVVLPNERDSGEAAVFIAKNRAWVVEQVERTRKLLAVRRPEKHADDRILFRGNALPVRIVRADHWHGPNKVAQEDAAITITIGSDSTTAVSRSLENWLRKQARYRFGQLVMETSKCLKKNPNRIYVMEQRTKWGNCSTLGNLSFNWRLVMAPDMVLRYIVTHEMVHLAIPDHSPRFWLMVQSLCPVADGARQWLVAHGHEILQPLPQL